MRKLSLKCGLKKLPNLHKESWCEHHWFCLFDTFGCANGFWNCQLFCLKGDCTKEAKKTGVDGLAHTLID